MAVRVFERLAEVGRDGLLQARRDGVFQRLGLGVHLAPVEAEDARQKQFDEAVPADDAPRLGDAGGRQASAGAGVVVDPAGVGEAFEHAGDRRGRAPASGRRSQRAKPSARRRPGYGWSSDNPAPLGSAGPASTSFPAGASWEGGKRSAPSPVHFTGAARLRLAARLGRARLALVRDAQARRLAAGCSGGEGEAPAEPGCAGGSAGASPSPPLPSNARRSKRGTPRTATAPIRTAAVIPPARRATTSCSSTFRWRRRGPPRPLSPPFCAG